MSYAAEHCVKRVHPSRDVAEGHRLLLIQNRKGNRAELDALHSYQCPNCGGWHVGKDRRVLQKARVPQWFD